ncbi:hypothetical protein GGF31_005632 [Allomyces arbusculus]|nr:hypothetical protein GGF31_005632 [Allomyces arbusculus]
MFAFTAPGRRRNHTGDASEDAALGFSCTLRLATVTRNLASPRWAEHAVPTPPETSTPDTELTDPPARDRSGTVSSTVFDDAVSTFSVASAAATSPRASASHARDTPPRHRFPVAPPPLPNHADPPPPPHDDQDDNAIPVRVAVILDGHGSRPEDGTSVGPGARVVAHLARHLPTIVRQLVHLDPGLLAEIPCLAAQAVAVAGELDANLAPTPAPSLSSTSSDDPIPSWYLPLLTHAVAHFKDLLNRFLDATFLVAAWDAGAALSATLQLGTDTVICANAGDCLLYALGHSNQSWTALPIWRASPLLRPPCPVQAARFAAPPPPRTVPRRGHTPLPLMDVSEIIDRDDAPRTSSYEDALVYYPGVLREGQHAQVAQRDWRLIAAHLKPARGHDDVPGAAAMGGGVVLTSPESRKKLRLVNSVGNLAHMDVLLPRTSVYPFRVDEWGIDRVAVVVMVSDGVRDVFPKTQDLVEVWHAVREKRRAVEVLGRWLAVPEDTPVPRRLNARIRTDVQRLGRARAPFQVVDARLQAAMDAAVAIMQRGREDDDGGMEVDGEEEEGMARGWQAYCELVVHLAVVLGSRDDATCIVCAVGGAVPDLVSSREDELALYVGPELPPRVGKEVKR